MAEPESGPNVLPPPRTSRGRNTRQRILDAAEEVFGRDGFHGASIVDITRGAGVAQGTFYLYFTSKEALFVELVRRMGHDMRRRLHEGTALAVGRVEAEEAGFRAFFDFVAQHPNVYRIVRECQFVAPREFRDWYERLADRYIENLRRDAAAGEIRDVDLETAAYCLMGMADFLGMRMVLWDGRGQLPPGALRTVLEIIRHGLLRAPGERESLDGPAPDR